jgi:hypothetical protein
MVSLQRSSHKENSNSLKYIIDRLINLFHQTGSSLVLISAAMIEWLCCLARTTEVLCFNLGATRHRINLEKSLTAVYLGSPGRCMLITCDIHRSLYLVSVHEELKWFSGETLHQAGLLSRARASNSSKNNIGLEKLSSDNTLYHKVAERRGFLLPYLSKAGFIRKTCSN